ncbi:hypothetical protein LINGRAHAP2_LOCUS15034 [Linum grandiflorum]
MVYSVLDSFSKNINRTTATKNYIKVLSNSGYQTDSTAIVGSLVAEKYRFGSDCDLEKEPVNLEVEWLGFKMT